MHAYIHTGMYYIQDPCSVSRNRSELYVCVCVVCVCVCGVHCVRVYSVCVCSISPQWGEIIRDGCLSYVGQGFYAAE